MRTILLIITGSIAGYKTPELIRLLRKAGFRVIPVLSKGGAHFVSALSLQAVAGEEVHGDLFSLTAEAKMGHIALSRAADLVLVAPASADFIAKMACGLADDLASTLVLASNVPLLVAPAMNVEMWHAPATQANMQTLVARGVLQAGPGAGALACGEEGMGRMADPEGLLAAVQSFFAAHGPLAGLRALVTAGPTREAIDPVRFISNYSSGKQGYELAQALAAQGAEVTLITGPCALAPPSLVAHVVRVESARDMLQAVEKALPADIAVCAAAVADWRVETAKQKIKKGKQPPALSFRENPDILATLSAHKTKRPRLVIGFAAETEDLARRAAAKKKRKGCDWLVANNVSAGVFGDDDNEVLFIGAVGKAEAWPRMSKARIAEKLVGLMVKALRKTATSANKNRKRSSR